MPSPAARPAAGLHRTIPALPVRDVDAAVQHYRERFGFEAGHESGDFAVMVREETVINLWGAVDDRWDAGVLHPVSRGGVTTTDFGTREFSALDLDGNPLRFFVWTGA